MRQIERGHRSRPIQPAWLLMTRHPARNIPIERDARTNHLRWMAATDLGHHERISRGRRPHDRDGISLALLERGVGKLPQDHRWIEREGHRLTQLVDRDRL